VKVLAGFSGNSLDDISHLTVLIGAYVNHTR
jgi:hypothetical protein